jgi:hypothetical protein
MLCCVADESDWITGATSGIVQDPSGEAVPRTAEVVAELGVRLSDLM